MAHIILISSSPSDPSRTDVALDHIAACLDQAGHSTQTLRLRTLPADPLLKADTRHPDLTAALDAVMAADGLVIGSPVYKATYSGLLKVFIDLLPMDALTGIPVLPILTGGSPAHVLALDHGLKPMLSTLGATTIAPGRFLPTRAITVATPTTAASLSGPAQTELDQTITWFLSELVAHQPATTD